MRWMVLIGLLACSSCDASAARAWKNLPRGATNAVQRDEDRHSADTITSYHVHVIEADMSEADFVAWCTSLDLPFESSVGEHAAGEAEAATGVFRACSRSQGSHLESIAYKQAAGAARGYAHYSSGG